VAISDLELARSKNIAAEQVPLLRVSRGTTNESLSVLSDEDIHQIVARLDFPDLPAARHAFRLRQQGGDDAIVPTNALGNAIDETLNRQGVQRPSVRAGLPTGARARTCPGRSPD
jgi:hypothetical protein